MLSAGKATYGTLGYGFTLGHLLFSLCQPIDVVNERLNDDKDEQSAAMNRYVRIGCYSDLVYLALFVARSRY